MKLLSLISLTLFTQVTFASTYFCSVDEIGVIQVDIDSKETRACVYQQSKNNQWTQIESGISVDQHDYFDNQDYSTKTKYHFLTEIRDFDFNFPKNLTEQFKASLSWGSESHFGPLINSGTALGTAGYCILKKDAKPCQAKAFKNPANTPKDFASLKTILDENVSDWWGDYPTFTLVSPDLSNFIVFTQTINGGAEVHFNHGGSTYSNEKELIKEEVQPKIKAGWKIVPVYSNESGIKYFKNIN